MRNQSIGFQCALNGIMTKYPVEFRDYIQDEIREFLKEHTLVTRAPHGHIILDSRATKLYNEKFGCPKIEESEK